MKKLYFLFLIVTCFPGLELNASSMSTPSYPETSHYQYIPQYLNSIDENTSLQEVIDFLFSVREMIINEGHQVPFFLTCL